MRESGSKTALANGINKTVGWPPGRMPMVPDRTMVTTEAAREALDGILVAAWYDKRFGDLGAAAASVRPWSLMSLIMLASALTSSCLETARSKS